MLTIEHKLESRLMTRFIVMESKARMPAVVISPYARIAVVEIEPGFKGPPKMISERARGVVRIVKEWGPCYIGVTNRCAAAIARKEATDLARTLNCPLERIVEATQ